MDKLGDLVREFDEERRSERRPLNESNINPELVGKIHVGMINLIDELEKLEPAVDRKHTRKVRKMSQSLRQWITDIKYMD